MFLSSTGKSQHRSRAFLLRPPSMFDSIYTQLSSIRHVSQANIWVELSPSGTAPSARSAHTAVWSPAANGFYVFGGCGSSCRALRARQGQHDSRLRCGVRGGGGGSLRHPRQSQRHMVPGSRKCMRMQRVNTRAERCSFFKISSPLQSPLQSLLSLVLSMSGKS